MTITFMKFIDRYVGALLLAILRLVMPVFDLLHANRRNGEVRTIIVQKYLGIGSIINAIPLIETLRRMHPQAAIWFVTLPEQRAIIELSGLADRVLVVDNSSVPRFILSAFGVAAALWRGRVQISIDLEFFSRFSMIMACVSGAPTRVGFFSFYNVRSPLLTHPVPFNHYCHISRIFLAHAEALGAPIEAPPTALRLPSMRERCQAELAELLAGREGRRLVVVNVNASKLCLLRTWPAANFVRLIQLLEGRFPDIDVALIGTKAEADYVDGVAREVAAASGRVLNLAGRTSFPGVLALLEQADLVISNDSGPAHIAAAYGRPEIVLFGPETPVLYAPLNPRTKVFYRPGYCSPCINVLENKKFMECTSRDCMTAITVEDVFAAAVDILAARLVAASP